MSSPQPGTIVFIYPDRPDDPAKGYPAIVCAVHAGAKAHRDQVAIPTTLDLMIFAAWHGAPVVERLGVPLLAKWDGEAQRPFALAVPYEKPTEQN